MIRLRYKELWIDGVRFEVDIAVGCNEEMISSVVCGLNESVGKSGSVFGETFVRLKMVEEIK